MLQRPKVKSCRTKWIAWFYLYACKNTLKNKCLTFKKYYYSKLWMSICDLNFQNPYICILDNFYKRINICNKNHKFYKIEIKIQDAEHIKWKNITQILKKWDETLQRDDQLFSESKVSV